MEEVGQPNPLKFRIFYYFASHKVFLKRLGFFLIILLSVYLYGYSAYHLTNYFLGSREYEAMIRELARDSFKFHEYFELHQPKPLIILETAALPGVSGKYDFVAQVQNPNPKWLARRVSYRFVWPGGTFEDDEEDFILPGEETYLLALNKEVSGQVLSPKIEFVNISWQRVKKLIEISDKDFIISDVEFISGWDITTLNGAKAPSRVKFKVRNNTFYNFWEAGFKVVLIRYQDVVGLHYGAAPQFKSGETISPEVIWLDEVPTPTEIKIEPAIDYLTSENYMPRESSEGELK
ncbi:hypothetical protein KKD19_06585 [Patescibacteria group bacterium]|nr:hypothetical protein [Patescibacteria group bacterium]MCG2693146.1 hypothetical protein [Candidatus Parcubacteria bacterium]